MFLSRLLLSLSLLLCFVTASFGAKKDENQTESLLASVLQLYGAKLPKKTEIAGFHGTNLAAVIQLIETGTLPPGIITTGHLYISLMREGRDGFWESRRDAIDYGGWLTIELEILKRLGITEFSKENRQYMSDFLTHLNEQGATNRSIERLSDSLSYFQKKFNIPREKILKTLEEIEKKDLYKKRGIVLAIDRRVLSDFEHSPGDETGVDEKINVGKGLPISYIKKIEAIGAYEKSFFKKLIKADIKKDVSGCISALLKEIE